MLERYYAFTLKSIYLLILLRYLLLLFQYFLRLPLVLEDKVAFFLICLKVLVMQIAYEFLVALVFLLQFLNPGLEDVPLLFELRDLRIGFGLF